MKRLLPTSIVLLLPVVACQSSGPAEPASVSDRLAADVTWLADDAREGRRAGTAGELASGDWIADRFEALELEPAGEVGWFQPFEVPLPSRDGGGSWIASDGVRLEGGSSVVPLTASARGDRDGKLALRGFGIVNADREWDDYGDEDLAGRIALVVRGEPSGGKPPEPESPDAPGAAGGGHGAVEQGAGWGETASLFHKVMTASRHGAIAVLIAPHPDADGGLPRFETGGEVRGPIPALAISLSDAERLLPGYSAYARELARVDHEHWAGREDEPAPPVRLFADVVRGRATARNVLARLPGGGGETVVVGAHYDHLGHGGSGSLEPGSEEIHNGADDNASGTAVVLEVARRLAAGPPPPGDVIFALWSGEELGLLGSEHWARHPTVALDDVSANVNLDMVGRAGEGTLSILGAGTSPAFAGWMDEVGSAAGLELQVSLSGSGLGGSDHQTFLKRQIPALHLFSGLHGDYHKPTDDVVGFEAEGAARVADLTLDLVRRIQAADELAYAEPEAADPSQGRGGRWSVRFGTVPEYSYDGEGLLLAGTSPGSPAQAAGLLPGDVLVGVGDVEIENIHSFVYALQIYKPGDVVLTRYLRDGKAQEVRVTLAARDAQ